MYRARGELSVLIYISIRKLYYLYRARGELSVFIYIYIRKLYYCICIMLEGNSLFLFTEYKETLLYV